MTDRDANCEGQDSVESVSFAIEDSQLASGDKLDRLVAIAAEVKEALNRRTITVAIAIVVPLVVGAGLLLAVYRMTERNQNIARTGYVQTLVNNRDNLISRREFAQTRDCPIEYFKDLLEVSRNRGDLTAVIPPCEPIDVTDLDEKITDVERKIAANSK